MSSPSAGLAPFVDLRREMNLLTTAIERQHAQAVNNRDKNFAWGKVHARRYGRQ